jgi:Fe-S-cluster containining protein
MLSAEILERFSCTGCGECCRWGGSVLLNDGDVTRLAGFMALSEQDFIDRHTRLAPDRRRLALLDQADGSCAFLQGSRCAVYDARPDQCRDFPYRWQVQAGCPELDRLLAGEKNIDQADGNP